MNLLLLAILLGFVAQTQSTFKPHPSADFRVLVLLQDDQGQDQDIPRSDEEGGESEESDEHV